MAPHDAAHWDERYAADDGLWASGPSPLVVEVVTGLGPGAGRIAVDLGAGEGRHAVWLARHGWRVTAVDFSTVAVDRGARHALEAGVEVTWVVADVADGAGSTNRDHAHRWRPPAPADLVLLAWLRLEQEPMAAVVAGLAPGGHLVVTGHGEPAPGARVSRFRQDPGGLRRQAESLGLTVERAEETPRSDKGGTDVVLVARR